MSAGACDGCLKRTWLLATLAGRIGIARHGRGGTRPAIEEILAVGDEQLIAALLGAERASADEQMARFDPRAARERAAAANLDLVCRCEGAYPRALRDLEGATPARSQPRNSRR